MANQPTIEQMNEVVALFMDLEPRFVKYPNSQLDRIEVWRNSKSVPIEYHTSWDWLMPVWIKFRSLELFGNEEYNDWIGSLSWYLYCASDPSTFQERLYYAIQWYNSTKK